MENNTASILEKLIIIGDRVLIKPLSDSKKLLQDFICLREFRRKSKSGEVML